MLATLTPGQVRDKIVSIMEQVRDLEFSEVQKQHQILYYKVNHELVEAWEALDRALEIVDAIGEGLS